MNSPLHAAKAEARLALGKAAEARRAARAALADVAALDGDLEALVAAPNAFHIEAAEASIRDARARMKEARRRLAKAGDCLERMRAAEAPASTPEPRS